MYYEVTPVKGFYGELTYESSDSLLPGQIVEIPLGRKKCVGVVLKKVAQPDFECKKIERIIYSKPLPSHLMAAARFIAEMDSQFLDFGGHTPRYTPAPRAYVSRAKPVRTTIVGKLVNHVDMGRGVVIEENENILTVAFNKTGIKKVARDFIEIIG